VTQYGRESEAVRKLTDTVTAADASYMQMYLIDWSVCNVLCRVGRYPLHKIFFQFHHRSPIQQNAPSSCLHRASMIIKHFIIQLMHDI